jgi:hypothetical protein
MVDECSHSYRAFNEDGEVVKMACDSWACEQCARALAWRWAERVRYGIALWPLQDAYFWTLTLPAWIHYPNTGFRILPDVWDHFRRTIQKVYPHWQYAAFVECHPHRNLIPHYHVISLSPAPIRLKDLAAVSGFGYEAWDVQITSRHAAGYVCKYASKQGYAMPRGFRRVRVSYGWPKLPKPTYDKTVYPIGNRESVKAYIRRVAGLTSKPYDDLMQQWLDAKGHTPI